jgi:hypothetical protein
MPPFRPELLSPLLELSPSKPGDFPIELGQFDSMRVGTSNCVHDAPVQICSDVPESDHMAMPVKSAIMESGIWPPLSYYQLSVPVTPLPRALNDEAMRDGSRFLQQAAQRHQRFLAMPFVKSYETLDWLRNQAGGTYSVRELGAFDGVKVLEFAPRGELPGPSNSRHFAGKVFLH